METLAQGGFVVIAGFLTIKEHSCSLQVFCSFNASLILILKLQTYLSTNQIFENVLTSKTC